MKFELSVAVVAIIALNTEAAIRGSYHEDPADRNLSMHQVSTITTQMMGDDMSGPGGPGGGSMNGDDDCPYFVKGWPSGVVGCDSDEECGAQGLGCCVQEAGAAAYGFAGYCGDPCACNCYLTCMSGRNAQGNCGCGAQWMCSNTYPTCTDPTPYSISSQGGDVIEIQAEDVDIQVYKNEEGNEVVQIASHHTTTQEQQVSHHQVAGTATDKHCGGFDSGTFYVQLHIGLNEDFAEDGSYELLEVQQSGSSDSVEWEGDGDDFVFLPVPPATVEDNRYTRTGCIDIDKCWVLEVEGTDDSSPDEAIPGFIKFWGDFGGNSIRLIYEEEDLAFKQSKSIPFGCGCQVTHGITHGYCNEFSSGD